MAGPVQLAGDFDDLCLGSADARRDACLVAGTGGGRCFIGRGRLDPLEVDLVDGERPARRTPGRSHEATGARKRGPDVYEDVAASTAATAASAEAFVVRSVMELAMRSASARSRAARAIPFRAGPEPF
jgi:hypothetical protein